MTKKEDLRRTRLGTVINLTSRKQESELGKALQRVVERLGGEFEVSFQHQDRWMLSELVEGLRRDFPEVDFFEPRPTSYMMPDGGILSIRSIDGDLHPVLITEVKNQGTNDLRAAEGKKRQAMGNAIERLGKNVVGFRAGMLRESIMPFVCFGYGIDFAEGSSILDRVLTIAMFGSLNTVHLMNGGDGGQFNRGSFYFRREEWSADEMVDVMYDVASRSIHYYFAKHGPAHFANLG